MNQNSADGQNRWHQSQKEPHIMQAITSTDQHEQRPRPANQKILSALFLLTTTILALGQTNFTRILDVAPVTDAFDGTGCAFVDYDNDGYIDLFVANFTGNNHLYHNEHGGTFKAITTGDIVSEGAQASYGVAWGDFNNDGFPDLFVGNGYYTATNNFLYRNNGDGTFTKITNGPIVTIRGGFTGCAWADYDRDGFIDLFVANDPSGPSLLLHNEGGTTFTRINSAPSVISDAVGVAWADFNNDGWPDLFVANGFSSDTDVNSLYMNQGGATFKRVLPPGFVSASLHSVGVAWGDYDNDGFPDVFVSNTAAAPETNELYHNNGNATFTRITAGSIVNDQSYSIAAAWGDYDNDGWLDLFVGNRTVNAAVPQKNFLYHNNGDGTFTRIASGPIVEYASNTGGCAWGDYDNDGFLDLFVSAPNALFHNTGNSNHWLKVKCEGTASNRSGIGVKVRLKATIAGKSFWQMREITSGDGIGSSALIAHFGLGDATNIDTVRIEWPSGRTQEIQALKPNQSLVVTEPPSIRAIGAQTDGFHLQVQTATVGTNHRVERSSNLLDWSEVTTLTSQGVGQKTTVVDSTSPSGEQARFYRVVWLDKGYVPQVRTENRHQ